MELLVLNVSAPVASFRRPLDLNYQRTLLVPPPTTLIGLAGAALGMSACDLWGKNSPFKDLKVSALVQPSFRTRGAPGRARDMWTVLKIKNNKITERSPYFRELLFFPRYTLLFGGPRELLESLKKAFLDPVYPLSLGREDELLWIEDEPQILPLTPAETATFYGTAVPGDIRELEVRMPLVPGLRAEPPVVETVPLAFEVDKKGVRAPLRRTSLTFIPLSLRLEIQGLSPIFRYRSRCFTWMNP